MHFCRFYWGGGICFVSISCRHLNLQVTHRPLFYVEDHHLPQKTGWPHQPIKKMAHQELELLEMLSYKSKISLREIPPSSKEQTQNIQLMEWILHQLIARLSHYWRRFIYARWLFGISSINRISPTTIEIPNSSLDLEHLPNPKHPSGERDSHTGAGKRGRCFLISRGPCYLLSGDMFVWWKKSIPWNWTKRTMKHTPWKINMEPENEPWERRFLLKTIIFRFHVSFPGGKSYRLSWSKTTWDAEVKKISLALKPDSINNNSIMSP